MKRRFTENQIKIIIDLYLSGKHQREIAEIMWCSQTLISKLLLENNVPTRVGKRIIYTDINTEFFDKIDTEEKAYFLGFLYADGNVHTDNSTYSLTLKLQNQDRVIIEKLRNALCPSLPIKEIDNKYSYMVLCQKVITDQLIALGCTPRKSLTLIFPTCVPAPLLRHFIRGYSDGDGTIVSVQHQKRKGNKIHYWKIISTASFCQSVSTILQQVLGISGSMSLSRPKTNLITTTLTIGGNQQVEKVLDWLYQDVAIYLPRKQAKYQELKQYMATSINHNNLPKRPDVDRQEVIEDYVAGLYLKEIAKKHQISQWFVSNIINKQGVPRRQPRTKK